MPIYEYACESCGHKLEKMQAMHEAPLTECTECHAHSLKKLVSATGFRLKGSGWYETDFKKDEKKKNLATDENSKTEKPVGTGLDSDKGTSKEVPKDTKAGESSTQGDSKTTSTE